MEAAAKEFNPAVVWDVEVGQGRGAWGSENVAMQL